MDVPVQFTPLFPAPREGKRFTWNGAIGSSDAATIAQNAEFHRSEYSVILIICSNPLEAQRLAAEIPIFNSELKVKLLPDWEILPYDNFSPHQDLISERLAALYELMNGACDIVIAPVSSAIQRLSPPEFLAAHTFTFKQGDKLDETALRFQLQQANYDPVTAVVRPGEYSLRGGLIDIFPMGSVLPYRIDLFGDEIDQIKTFDPDTQRSLYPVKEVRLLPGHEFPFDEDARKFFRGKWREYFDGDPSKCSLYKDVGNGIPGSGIECYLPLFFENTATIFDYFPIERLPVWIWTSGDIQLAIQSFWQNTQERYNFLSHDSERPILKPEKLFIEDDDFFGMLKKHSRAVINQTSDSNSSDQHEFTSVPDVSITRKSPDPIHKIRHLISNSSSRILICTDSPGRRETVKQLLEDELSFENSGSQIKISPNQFENINQFIKGSSRLGIVVAPILDGFHSLIGNILFISESELFTSTSGQRKSSRNKQRNETTNVDTLVRDLSELKIGDPVVHSEHGIGRYHGLIMLDLGNGNEEFLYLSYANSATLYVPVHQLHLISRYAGADPETAPLHNLGSDQWERSKRKAAQQIRDTAAELLNLYAARSLRKGHSFEFSAHDYEAFSESFGFEETPDQAQAISAVIQDMTSGKPMDRLVCGDVGFGKTEVALRASFIAVMGGKQVAILAPTTLLAEQHANTWKDRFADWPVKIVELSRFKTAKEITAALKSVANGEADIVIGTHKLLSPDLTFPRLGLVIIDEEHRFGVRQKEALKALRAEVDILNLTATPIPRTLGMALEGLRDFSVIATAPQKRLAIKTFVRREGDDIIREAALREIKRGGQLYFLHNEVETIENRKQALQKLLPEARISVAHGQMHERELEQVMKDFVSKRSNILLCTTIIETGIDVPNANTIIMHRADKFGLAQLHQLRGRVGRSHHQAYAYLLVPDPEGLSKQAKLRLEAIQAMEELGSGFYLAMHDLEIRGAGEVLGDKQSGEIHEIGFQLYTEMLNKAVKSLKNGSEPDLMTPMKAVTDISLGIPALLPNDYCPDVHERLSLYKRLASSEDLENLNLINEELVDRFGPPPEAAEALLNTHRLRLNMTEIGLRKIDASTQGISLQFIPSPPIDPIKIIHLIQTNKHIQLNGQDRLKIAPKSEGEFENSAKRIDVVKQLIAHLKSNPAPNK